MQTSNYLKTMADPLSLANLRLHGLRSRVKEAKTNRTGCQLLVGLAEHTLDIFYELQAAHFESSIDAALELVSDALGDAEEAVEKCCNTAFFIALLYNEDYAVPLKHAAEKLEHGLTAIPLASLKMTTDFQTQVNELSAQIRTTRFEERAATSRHVEALNDVLEREFHQTGQEYGNRKINTAVLPQDITLKTEDQRKKSLMHREYEDEEKKNKEKQQNPELDQTIARALETTDDMSEAPSVIHILKECFRCPISKQIMRDPVVLKDSGITYDRSSIEEWLGRNYGSDPLTHVKLASRDLAPIPALRIACQALLEQSKAHSTIVGSSQEEDSKQTLEPGLYEGKGELLVGSNKGYTSQLLILEPNGGVVGCTLYKGKDFGDEKKNVELGVGEWDGNKRELFFRDNRYNYHGGVTVLARHTQTEFRWNRIVSAIDDPTTAFASPLIISPPPKGLFSKLHPTILLMEGNIDSTSNPTTYKSKLVLSLEPDSTIGGWIYFDMGAQESKTVGRIMEGRWAESGFLTFSIHLLSPDTQSDYVNAFDITGIISHDEILNYPTFTSVVTKIESKGTTKNVKKKPTLLDGIKHLEYQLMYEVSIHWHCGVLI